MKARQYDGETARWMAATTTVMVAAFGVSGCHVAADPTPVAHASEKGELKALTAPPEASRADARFDAEGAATAVCDQVVSSAPAIGEDASRLDVADSPRTPVPAPEPADPLPADADLSIVDYIAEHCLVDRFAHDRYMVEWFQARGEAPLDVENPFIPRTPLPPRPGDTGYADYVADLKADWRQNPRSHVLDCEFEVERRNCELCGDGSGYNKFRYGLYLPEAYLRNPDQIATMLLLTPGGRGGRTRWFLEPIPYKGNASRLTQGLSTQKKLDEYLKTHPDRLPPIVVSMDDPGFPYTNGIYEYMTYDLPNHVVSTYFDNKTMDDFAFGVDAISSGSKNAAVAFLHKPEVFDTFGWMATFCAPHGFNPKSYFHPAGLGDRAIKVWQQRARDGELHMKFGIGKMDKYIHCNREIHSMFVDKGIIPADHETYNECPESRPDGKPVTARDCNTYRPGMTEHAGKGHNYGVMTVAFDDHLYWHVDKLTDVARSRP